MDIKALAGTLFREVESFVDRRLKRFDEALDALERRLVEKMPAAPDLDNLARRAAALVPAAKDGRDADEAAILERLSKLLPAAPDLDDLARRAAALVPPAPPAAPPAIDLDDLARRAAALVPPPKDGRSVELKDVADYLEGVAGRWQLEFERRAADVLQRAIDAIPAPKDGRDGLSLQQFDARMSEDGRTVVLTLSDGERVERRELPFPVLIYRGLFKPGAYREGDSVTYGGSLWVAKRDTSQAPGSDAADWQLAAKRGRDGRDAVPAGAEG